MAIAGYAVTSDTAGLVVYKLPEIVTQPADTTTCELLNVTFTVDVGDTDAPFLQWEEDDGSSWQPCSATEEITLVPTPPN